MIKKKQYLGDQLGDTKKAMKALYKNNRIHQITVLLPLSWQGVVLSSLWRQSSLWKKINSTECFICAGCTWLLIDVIVMEISWEWQNSQLHDDLVWPFLIENWKQRVIRRRQKRECSGPNWTSDYLSWLFSFFFLKPFEFGWRGIFIVL